MKKNFIDVKDDFVSTLNRQKKLTAIVIGAVVVLVVSLFIIVPKVQANIRSSEIKSLVSQEKLAKKASYLDFKTADQFISEKTAVTVLFSIPGGDIYDKTIKILKNSEKMKEFNHSIYIYPMVYEAEKIETKYSVKKDDVTVVFFENGKEKNRLPVDSSLDLQTMLIPALNQLPLSNVGQSIQPPATPAQTTQQSTTSQSNAEQETGQSVEGETVAE